MFDVNISPDGKRVAVNRGDPADIWIYELARGTSLRLTFDLRNETLPVWSPDGRFVAYARIEREREGGGDGGAARRRGSEGAAARRATTRRAIGQATASICFCGKVRWR